MSSSKGYCGRNSPTKLHSIVTVGETKELLQREQKENDRKNTNHDKFFVSENAAKEKPFLI